MAGRKSRAAVNRLSFPVFWQLCVFLWPDQQAIQVSLLLLVPLLVPLRGVETHMPEDLGLGYAENGDEVAGIHVSSEFAVIFNSG